jgi:membrane-associated phospholipid phosphatase
MAHGRDLRRRNWGETLWVAMAPILARLSLGLVAAVVAMWGFVALAEGVTQRETHHVDSGALQFLRDHRSPHLFEAMRFVSWIGDVSGHTVLVLSALGWSLIRRRPWPDTLSLLLATAGGVGVVTGLKHLFERPRPEEVFSDMSYSFPSGHSFFAVVVYGFIGYWLSRDASPVQRRWVWAGVTLAVLLVGFSRMYLGVHFPTDVAAGYAIGVAWLWGCLALPQAFHQRGRDLTTDQRRARYAELSEQLRDASRLVPNLARLATDVALDHRVPVGRKVVLALVAAYLASPIDFIPDFVPVVGAADDLVLVHAAMTWVAKAAPREVVAAHWRGEGDPFALLDSAKAVVHRFWRGG